MRTREGSVELLGLDSLAISAQSADTQGHAGTERALRHPDDRECDMMPTAGDPRDMQDHELVEAYEATDGDPKDLEVSKLVDEIERRGLDV
jgi:hypothetical protein